MNGGSKKRKEVPKRGYALWRSIMGYGMNESIPTKFSLQLNSGERYRKSLLFEEVVAKLARALSIWLADSKKN
jgi:hypothetical protein